jgi:hypothetical protein
VEPAVAYLTRPLLSIHGSEITGLVSEALVSLLLPLSTRAAARKSPFAVIFTDALGQVCIRLQPLAGPLVVWPVIVGRVRREDAPQPSLQRHSMSIVSSGPEFIQQISRTRLLVRSLVLQSAMDLMALAKTSEAEAASHVPSSHIPSPPKRKKPLTIEVPELSMTPVEIIRTAIPVCLPSANAIAPSADMLSHFTIVAGAPRTSAPSSPLLSSSILLPHTPTLPSSTMSPSSTASPLTPTFSSTIMTPTPTDATSCLTTPGITDKMDVSTLRVPEAPCPWMLEPILFSPLYLGDFSSLASKQEPSRPVTTQNTGGTTWSSGWREYGARWTGRLSFY